MQIETLMVVGNILTLLVAAGLLTWQLRTSLKRQAIQKVLEQVIECPHSVEDVTVEAVGDAPGLWITLNGKAAIDVGLENIEMVSRSLALANRKVGGLVYASN